MEEIFHAAMEADAAQRDALLDRACAGDETLRREVLELLQAAEASSAADFWSGTAAETDALQATAAEANAFLGAYRLLAPIGAGGMGVVYKAARADDAFSKVVAVKLLGWSAADPLSVRRGLQEREILARLEHPHIARLLDGGEAPDGRPYLVMEYVDGMAIDRFAGENSLTLGQRLTLFRQVCEAVSYAHRNLVVHRDLKPANILVTAGGEAKLLDFGIARLIPQSQDATLTSMAALTPEYASPEQLRQLPVTTLSDVYSLGVTLYKVLTGRRPYGSLSGADLAQAVCEKQPSFTGTPIRGDLQTILETALHKDPERRYPSVDEFAADLRRFQESYPIRARGDSLLYRAGRFAARHRLATSVTAIGAVVLAVLATGLFLQWRQSQLRAEEIRALSGEIIFGVYDEVRDLPGSMAARRHIAGIAIRYLDRLAQERNANEALRLSLAVASRKLGDILGEPYAPSLGDTAGALLQYQRAQQLLESGPHAPAELATTYERLSRVRLRQGDVAQSRSFAVNAVNLRKADYATSAKHSTAALNLLQAYLHLGEVLYQDAKLRSDAAAAASVLEIYELARAVGQPVTEQAPGMAETDQAHAWDVWGIFQRHSAYVHWLLGELAPSKETFQRAVLFTKAGYEAAEKADRASPGRFSLQWTLTGAYGDHGHSLMLAGDLAGGIAWHDRSLEGLLRLQKFDPTNQELRREIADTALRLGHNRAGLQPHRAAQDYRNALSMYTAFIAANPSNLEDVGLAVETRTGLAQLLLRQGDRAAAARLHGESLDLLRKVNYPGDLPLRVEALHRQAQSAP